MLYEIPFDFSERIPLLEGCVNGQAFPRFILDTGAPISFLHDDVAKGLGLGADEAGCVHVDSLRFAGFEVGPLRLPSKSFGAIVTSGLLGTRELAAYCVEVDLDRQLCILGESPGGSEPSSEMSFLSGRPVVRIQHFGASLRFVLDTGSSVNWLFASGIRKLKGFGEAATDVQPAQGAHGDIPVHESLRIPRMMIGGISVCNASFLCSEEFAGGNAPEDGILGVGALTTSGSAIIDFPSGRFVLKPFAR